MDDPAQAYEPETYYAADREPGAGVRVLWGRLIALGVALLLAFVAGRASAPEGVSPREVDTAREQLAAARAEIERLKTRAATTEPAATASPTPTPTATSSPSPSPTAQGREQVYVIQPGDTLRGIAVKFYGDASLATLIAQANNIQDPAKIRAGQKLVIPPKPPKT